MADAVMGWGCARCESYDAIALLECTVNNLHEFAKIEPSLPASRSIIYQIYNSKLLTTVCPPVAELAPRRFGQLFFGRQSGPGWSDF